MLAFNQFKGVLEAEHITPPLHVQVAKLNDRQWRI